MSQPDLPLEKVVVLDQVRLPQDRYAQVGEARIRYWDEGRGDPVLLIHGFAANCEFWRFNFGAIAQHHRTIALDLPGHGLSAKRIRDASAEFAVELLARFMDALEIPKAHVVGKSMGGGLALALAALRPERVNKLVLVNSAGLGREVMWRFRAFSMPWIGQILARPSRPGVRWLQQSLCARPEVISDEWVDRFYELARLPGASQAILSIARHWVDGRGQRVDRLRLIYEKLPQIRTPTLILWGDRDPAVPVRHAFVGQRMIPGARLHIFPQCGHMSQMEVPEEFNRVLLEFLGEPSPPQGTTEENDQT